MHSISIEGQILQFNALLHEYFISLLITIEYEERKILYSFLVKYCCAHLQVVKPL
jgi:hypothetical protein